MLCPVVVPNCKHFLTHKAPLVLPPMHCHVSIMKPANPSRITAVLGPTNTGKTHLAIERMCAHSSGMMAFPLRLLAREVYDRVVAIKGAAQVALITGEERIVPPDARYFLCTAEAMPDDPPNLGSVAFLALDEAQLAGDPDRGHVFTARMLHARGREETMLLGSATLAPVIRALIPEAEIVTRPRFSTLSFGGSHKLSRLPKRSVIVSFSAQDVYATAEALRRLRGGAAVVMGALSPRTRNKQVEMFQSGQVDYLVATDAVGMGLNLDVAHVAFASLTKFDGRRQRRLTHSEMAQIAGRAGRHQRDGTFGLLSGQGLEFSAEDISRLEEHHLPKMSHIYWRQHEPDFTNVDALIANLEAPPEHTHLLPAPQAVDLAVLKWLADDPDVRAIATSERALRILWECCSIPDFQSLGPDHHGRLALRIWQYRSTSAGHIDHRWVADQLVRLDRVDGDIDTLSTRIAAVRVWCYIAQRSDWLADAAHFAERSRDIENRLSDALHRALMDRFIDVRTSVLLRGAARDAIAQVEIDAEDGSVSVDGAHIGRVSGFRFDPDPAARGVDRKRLMAAAEKHLAHVFRQKAEAICASTDPEFTIALVGNQAPGIDWNGLCLATLERGKSPLHPVVQLAPDLTILGSDMAGRVRDRVEAWLGYARAKWLAPIVAAEDKIAMDSSPDLRVILAALVNGLGMIDRAALDRNLRAISPEDRTILTRMGYMIGTLDIYATTALRPAAMLFRLALNAAWQRTKMPVFQSAGTVLIRASERQNLPAAIIADIGYRPLRDAQGGKGNPDYLRIDMIERLAKFAHQARLAHASQKQAAEGETTKSAETGFAVDTTLATSIGLSAVAHDCALHMAGFRMHPGGGWMWKGRDTSRKPRRRAAPDRATPAPPAKAPYGAAPAIAVRPNAFAALSTLLPKA